MLNITPKSFQLQEKTTEKRQNLLPPTRLSQLPKLSERLKPQVVVCCGCGGQLDLFDGAQESLRACRKCLQVYANLDTAFDKKAERKKKELLEKFAAEVKR